MSKVAWQMRRCIRGHRSNSGVARGYIPSSARDFVGRHRLAVEFRQFRTLRKKPRDERSILSTYSVPIAALAIEGDGPQHFAGALIIVGSTQLMGPHKDWCALDGIADRDHRRIDDLLPISMSVNVICCSMRASGSARMAVGEYAYWENPPMVIQRGMT